MFLVQLSFSSLVCHSLVVALNISTPFFSYLLLVMVFIRECDKFGEVIIKGSHCWNSCYIFCEMEKDEAMKEIKWRVEIKNPIWNEKNLITLVVDKPNTRCLISKIAWRNLSKGSLEVVVVALVAKICVSFVTKWKSWSDERDEWKRWREEKILKNILKIKEGKQDWNWRWRKSNVKGAKELKKN